MNHPFLGDGGKGLFIDGGSRLSVSGDTFDCINPSTGEVVCQVARGGAADIDLAVAAARRAFGGEWANLKPLERQSLMMRVAAAIDARFDELASLESIDMGAPIARTSMYRRWIQQCFIHYIGLAGGLRGEVFSNSVPGDFFAYSLKVPIGVVGAIIPWNGPLLSQLWSICPTLATGCTLVLKPPEEAPLSSLLMAEILTEAGVPAGVVNVVPGPGATAGAALASHTDVDKITFTGSTTTGRQVVQASTANMKRVTVELGGKSPNIVFADADFDSAVVGAAMGCFGNTGQICFAGTRLLIQRSIYDGFVDRVAAFGRTLKVGDALDPASQLGPLASSAQLERVEQYFEVARSEGVEVVSGGERLTSSSRGFFVPPTVMKGVDNNMRIAREEVFGPVLAAIPFDTEEDAILLANDTGYGLGGGVWTRDVGRVQRVSRALQCGMTWANCYGVSDPAVTFTGTKLSGYGVKGGPWATEDYLLNKTIWSNAS